MKTRPLFGLVILTLFVCHRALAQVTLDGTLGKSGTLPGPDYQIGAELGQQHGSNLFHSFQDFNLQSHESAIFSGPDNVQNVISRVTGGNPSSIDGTIRSTIPNADMYLLNPYGIMFGPHAKLDVQGGFHASTADYLRLQDGGRFEARTPGNSLLTVAPVAAFGFLTDTPATITTQDSTLTVPPFKPLSLIGGNLLLQGSLPIQFDDLDTHVTFASSSLHTLGGPLYLAAVGSAGEVQVGNLDLTLTGRGGEIRLDHTLVDTSGLGSGNLKVRGRWLWMQDSTLQANTFGEMDGGLMDLQLTESLHASSTPYYFSAFYSDALGRGKGGSVLVKAPEVTLNRVYMAVNPVVEGAVGGNTDLEVTRLSLLEGGAIANSAFAGKAGDLTIKATESILIAGQSIGNRSVPGGTLIDFPSFIDSTIYPKASMSGLIYLVTPRLDMVGGLIGSVTMGNGIAGNIIIQADNVNLLEGSYISTSAMAGGLAGSISLTVTDTLFLSGHRTNAFVVPATNQRIDQAPSSISSFSLSSSGGEINLTAKNIHLTKRAWISTSSLGFAGENSSSLNLHAENLLITENGQINSSNGIYGFLGPTTLLSGMGSGGDLHIQAKHLTIRNQYPHPLRTGIFSDTYSRGSGGNIEVQSDTLDMVGDVGISARSHEVGNAGQINLRANYLHLTQHSSISTAAAHGGGGNINLTGLSGLLYLDDSEITTSVAGGAGSGGNITIGEPQFTVLNKGLIRAQADAGDGGNIRIVAEQFIATPDSLVSASSRLGIDGQVMISSPDPNLSSKLFLVSTKGLDVTNQLKRPCGSAKSLEEIMNPRFKFYVYPIAGSRQSVEDWGPSPLPSRSASSSSQVKTGKGSARGRGKPSTETVAQAEYQPVALVVECPKAETGG